MIKNVYKIDVDLFVDYINNKTNIPETYYGTKLPEEDKYDILTVFNTSNCDFRFIFTQKINLDGKIYNMILNVDLFYSPNYIKILDIHIFDPFTDDPVIFIERNYVNEIESEINHEHKYYVSSLLKSEDYNISQQINTIMYYIYKKIGDNITYYYSTPNGIVKDKLKFTIYTSEVEVINILNKKLGEHNKYADLIELIGLEIDNNSYIHELKTMFIKEDNNIDKIHNYIKKQIPIIEVNDDNIDKIFKFEKIITENDGVTYILSGNKKPIIDKRVNVTPNDVMLVYNDNNELEIVKKKFSLMFKNKVFKYNKIDHIELLKTESLEEICKRLKIGSFKSKGKNYCIETLIHLFKFNYIFDFRNVDIHLSNYNNAPTDNILNIIKVLSMIDYYPFIDNQILFKTSKTKSKSRHFIKEKIKCNIEPKIIPKTINKINFDYYLTNDSNGTNDYVIVEYRNSTKEIKINDIINDFWEQYKKYILTNVI